MYGVSDHHVGTPLGLRVHFLLCLFCCCFETGLLGVALAVLELKP